MTMNVQPRELLIEQIVAIKGKYGVDPRSVSVGDCLAVMETMAGYLLGHDRALEDVVAGTVDAMRAVKELRRELRILRQRARRWQTRP